MAALPEPIVLIRQETLKSSYGFTFAVFRQHYLFSNLRGLYRMCVERTDRRPLLNWKEPGGYAVCAEKHAKVVLDLDDGSAGKEL